jgi:hypothetical protein
MYRKFIHEQLINGLGKAREKNNTSSFLNSLNSTKKERTIKENFLLLKRLIFLLLLFIFSHSMLICEEIHYQIEK